MKAATLLKSVPDGVQQTISPRGEPFTRVSSQTCSIQLARAALSEEEFWEWLENSGLLQDAGPDGMEDCLLLYREYLSSEEAR